MVDKKRVASMNPENMLQGGLEDDFNGVITKVRFVPWDYEGTLDKDILAVAVTIKPDESDEFVQNYSAGDLENFLPSMDGENAVDLSDFRTEGSDPTKAEGIYALQVGEKTGLTNSTNWAQFITSALESGFPKDKLDAAVSFFEGAYGHFNRIAQKKRAGLIKAEVPGAKKRASEILVMTEFKGFKSAGSAGAASGAKKPTTGGGVKTGTKPATTNAPSTAASTSTASAATTTGGTNELDTALIAIVVNAATPAEDGINKSVLPGLALKHLPAAMKGKGVKRIVDVEFLNAHDDVFVFDPDSGTIFAVPTE